MADDEPLDPEAARLLARVRRLMMISLFVTIAAAGGVLAVVGWRLTRTEGIVAPADASVRLPKGARVIATTATEQYLVVTVETGGATEVRTFDLRTLKPAGQLRFTPEP